MVLRGLLARLAAGSPVPVFPVGGIGAREAVQDLRLRDELRVMDGPGAANVLLLAGSIPQSWAEPLARVHDAMSHPRATVWWSLGAPEQPLPDVMSHALRVDVDAVETLMRTHRGLLAGALVSEPPMLPDEDPAPWRGVGPYGQGGGGMTGGTPYGRPMASLADDRDGLRLDLLPLSVGPFFPRFPSGLVLELKLAGDVIQEATVRESPLAGDGRSAGAARPGLRPFLRALTEPVLVAELELARAQEHLRWLADALIAHELPAFGARALRLAARVTAGDSDALRRLTRDVERTQVLRWATNGVGRLTADDLRDLHAGPVTRAAGVGDDARIEDPAYRQLGFEPVVQADGDAAARWRQRLAEAAQSLDLAVRAGELHTTASGRVESPRGLLEAGSAPAERLLALVPGLIKGREWGDAIASIVSLDIDLEEAAWTRRAVAQATAP